MRGKMQLNIAVEALNKVKKKFENDTGRLAVITPDLYDETYNIMGKHYTPDEPLCNAFGVIWPKDFWESIHKNLIQNISICMISKDTNEIMGIRIFGIMKKTDSPADYSSLIYEPRRDLLTFLSHKDSEIDFFEKYGVDEAIHFFALGVHRKYRRMGIGGRLFAASVAMSAELGFKAIQGEGTSKFTQNIYEKHGFETLLTLPYDKYIYKGKPLIEATGAHTMSKLYGLKL